MSFKERTELSLIPSKVRRHPDHVIRAKGSHNISALKAAVIYGANASGKSNLIKAIHHAQQMINMGVKSGKKLPHFPFRLSKDCLLSPSRFEFEIKVGKYNYAYGFVSDSNSVHEEWLFKIDKVKDLLVFKRELVGKRSKFEFGDIKFENEKDELFLEFTAKGTPENRLFLNECNERNISTELVYLQGIIDVNNWFENKLTIVFPHSKYSGLEMDIQKNQKTSEIFSKILNSFDTGISQLSLHEIDYETELVGIPDEVKQGVLDELENHKNILLAGPHNTRYQLCKNESGEVKAFKLMTSHQNNEGGETFFEINQESDGTQRLLDIVPGLLDIFSHEKIYIIDEIDRSLHPEITSSILNSFLNNTKNIRSQLIVTTHETSLLNQKIVRKDELWFVQKNNNGESLLYSLEEYQPRFDKDIRKGYLAGRFGGLPLLTSFKNLSWMNSNA